MARKYFTPGNVNLGKAPDELLALQPQNMFGTTFVGWRANTGTEDDGRRYIENYMLIYADEIVYVDPVSFIPYRASALHQLAESVRI